MLIIRDKEGYVYGGYASQPWERHADFYGDMKSFLFQLSPKSSIFRPTGANHNIQWVSVLNLCFSRMCIFPVSRVCIPSDLFMEPICSV